MIPEILQAEVERHLKQKIVAISPLSAANTVQIYRILLESKRTCVAKLAMRGMDVEAYMLNYLREKSKLPVPTVHYCNEHIIIMDFIDSGHSLNDACHRHAAELLADLHKVRADSYGMEKDTLFASFRQPNTRSKDWVKFFTEHRLLYMANETVRENKIDSRMMKQIEKLAGKIGSYIKNPAPPSLIHGDVWTGNLLPGKDKILAFLDPAIYYADPEIELAFIRLFNTFDGAFFTRYNEITPLRPGFIEERADIYNLYPLLAYIRLFGPSYARKVQRILDKFA